MTLVPERILPLATDLRVLLLFGLLTYPASSNAVLVSLVPPKQASISHASLFKAPVVPVVADKTALYNRDVNRIVSFAVNSKTRQTWLGYGNGVKLVDSRARVVRHYGIRDGLPVGQVMVIAMDTQGASSGETWCIVRAQPKQPKTNVRGKAIPPVDSLRAPHPDKDVPPLRMHLCAFSPTTGRWKIFRTILPAGSNDRVYFDVAPSPDYSPNRLFVGHVGRPRIDVGADAVTFSLGIATPAEPVAVYQWNRQAKRLETLRWDARIRTENPALIVTFLTTDRTKGGLWIGTNAGLLYRPKTTAASVATAPVLWSRLLPDQVIGEGTAATDGGVWVTTTSRVGDDGFYPPLSPENPWKMFRVWGPAHKQARDVTPAIPDRVGFAEPRKEGRIGPTLVNRSFPVAVTIDAKGALWLTQKGIEKSGFGWTGYSPGDTLDAWWRRDPKGDGWTRYERHRPWRPDSEMLSVPLLRETTAMGIVRDNLSLNVLPDVAVCPLALYPFEQQKILMMTLHGKSDEPIRRATEDPRAIFWMRRFPAWICTSL